MRPPRHPTRPTPAAGGYQPQPGGDSGRPPFSVVFEITGETTYEGVTAYTGHEVWVYGDGITTEVQNGHVLTASQPGVPLDGTEFEAGDLALGRLGPGAGGRVWELAAFGESAGDDPTASDCRAKLAGLRANECVSFQAIGNDLVESRTFGGRWDAAAGGWKGLDFFETGDGITRVVLFRKAEGGMGLRLIGQTQTWHAADLGLCSDGKQEFAAPYCPPDLPDSPGSGAGSGESEDCAALADCADHTFRVRVVCVGCDSGDGPWRARVPACDTFSATPVVLYMTITGVTGGCNAGMVGKTIPLYYVTPPGGLSPDYYPLQADIDAAGWPCGTPLGLPSPLGSGYLFQTSGCNIFGFGANGYDGVTPPVSTDPFVYEGTWTYGVGFACCPGGGTIDFTLSEDAP